MGDEPQRVAGRNLSLPVCRPDRPSALVPDFLHRGHDGWVPFARLAGDCWQELGSVPAADLRGLFADQVFTDAIQADSYFGVHAMYRPAPYRGRNTLPGLRPSLRSVDSVRYLTCCHVDLDGYKHGLDSHGMIAAVMRLVDEGTLPPPSLFTLSRGAWALWRLHDQLHPQKPLRNYPATVMSRWCRVQGALTRICAAIGSDQAAKHAATVTRIPGSVNSKNGRSVGYMLPAGVDGRPFSYTLADLERVLRPHLAETVYSAPTRPKSQNPALSSRGLRGWRGRWRRLLTALGQLRAMRGGWQVGHRNSALFYVSLALRGLAAPAEDVRHVMEEHLTWMEQPPSDRLRMPEAMRVYNSVKRIRGRGASLQAAADALDVNPSEAAMLSEGQRKRFPSATRHNPIGLTPPSAVPRPVSMARRRAAVRAICDNLVASGVALDGAVVAAHLDAQGLAAARGTVLTDMLAVGHRSSRAQRSRPTPADDAVAGELLFGLGHPASTDAPAAGPIDAV